MLRDGQRPLAHRFCNGERYEPNADLVTTQWAGVFELDNPLGTFYPDLAQAGALVLSEGSNSVVGGCGRVKITADGNTITVPGAWVNVGTDSIDTTAAAVNLIIVLKVSTTEINYVCKNL